MSRVTKEINKISLAVISISGRIVFYVLAAALLITGAKKGYAFGHSIFYAPGTPQWFPSPQDVTEVGKLLEDIGLIRDHNAFSIQALCYGYEVIEGTWKLNTSLSSKEIIDLLDQVPEGEK